MYIEPNTTIYLLSDVQLDPNYENVIYTDNPSVEETYFQSKVRRSFSKQSYQRVSKGKLRVQANANDIYSCNYMMFQNTSYSNKWFYAFLLNAEYVNDNVAEITYEIDVFTTWAKGLTFEPCFIERMHTLTDEIGEHLVPENFELGDYVVAENGVVHTFMGGDIWDESQREEWWDNPEYLVDKWRGEWVIVLALFVVPTLVASMLPASPGFTGGVAQQCSFKIYDPKEDSAWRAHIWADLQTLGILNDNTHVANIFMYPKVFIPDYILDNQGIDQQLPSNPNSGYMRVLQVDKNFSTMYGFQPNNNKLFTYPYCYLQASNNQGSTMAYKWERFDTEKAWFVISSSLSANPSMTLMPERYRGMRMSVDDRLVISQMPTVSHATNDAVAKGLMAVGTIAGAAIGFAVGGAGGAMVGSEAGERVVKTVTKKRLNKETGRMKITGRDITTVPNDAEANDNNSKYANTAKSVAQKMTHIPTNGASGDNDPMMNMGFFEFTFERIKITDEFARIIDNFFDLYGYAVNVVETPRFDNRPHWTYIKTTNAHAHGEAPADVLEKIENILNEGSRVWRKPDEIGHYWLDNKPQ